MIGLVTNAKNKEVTLKLLDYLKTKNYDVTLVGSADTKEVIDNCQILAKAFKDKKIAKAIVIDDYGIAPFMYLAKQQNLIVAEIADEHSATMTADHNGSNVLTFGTKMSTLTMMKSMAEWFLPKKYSGGRHQSRIDMMAQLLSKEAK